MFGRLKAMFGAPIPSGPIETVKRFSTMDSTLGRSGISVEGEAWRIHVEGEATIRLFEVTGVELERCMLTYRAVARTEDLTGRAFLEMWCRLPGKGEFFSKGLDQALTGSADWTTLEIPFLLKQGQRPDLIKLNLSVSGDGTVWLRDLQLLKTPL